MKITAVRTFVVFANWRNLVLVKVETDEGVSGVGEATLEGKEQTVVAAIKELERYLLGKDPFRIEQHWQAMYRHAFWRGGPVLNSAISGVEQALWDILGKALGVPVYTLLGGPCRDRVRVYAGGWSGGCQTPEQYAEKAAATVAEGYTALKWDPFITADYLIEPENICRAVSIVRAVRQAVGDDVDLLIEVHGRFNTFNAIRVAHLLEEFHPFFYEEPVPPENIDAMARVAQSIRIPVATGERLFTKWGFRELLEKQAAAIIQPDPCHAGGILECKKIAAMAEAYYVAVAPHNPNGEIATAVSVHLDACIPNFIVQELCIHDWPSRYEIVTEPFTVEKGYIQLPNKPGWGMELDEKAIARHPYRPVDLPPM